MIRSLKNTVLNDISSMYLAGVCTVGAFVWVHWNLEQSCFCFSHVGPFDFKLTILPDEFCHNIGFYKYIDVSSVTKYVLYAQTSRGLHLSQEAQFAECIPSYNLNEKILLIAQVEGVSHYIQIFPITDIQCPWSWQYMYIVVRVRWRRFGNLSVV